MKRPWFILSLVLLLAAVATLSASATPGGTSTSSATPGVSKTSIRIGGTFPLSGFASIYAPIPRGMDAYFKYVNSRRGTDGKRGVYGRRIVWKYYDDAYNPAQTVQLTHKLVLEDKVFGVVGSLGTEHNLAIRPYLNDRKVPHVLLSTGASIFGLEYEKWPWTIGWQPDYIAEGRIYGRWIATNAPRAKIAVFYQNDDYGKDYLKGLEEGLGDKKSLIVSREHYEATDSQYAPQIARQKISGADTWVLLTTPTPTVRAMLHAKGLNWKPDTIVINSVAASDAVMQAAEQRAGKEYTNGAISTSYLKNPPNPRYRKNPTIKRYRQIAKRFAPGQDPDNVIFFYGFAKAYDTVRLLYKAGPRPTRASFMRATRSMNWFNPYTIQGMRVKTGPRERFPLDQVKLIRFQDGSWTEISALIKGR
jgi:branched-chain amino acid transport system substrate-binding protein